MRQIGIIGKYIILFNDVNVTFVTLITAFFIMILAFGLGFHVLLSNQELFSKPEYAIMKTMIMFSGEYDYSDIFFSDDGPSPFPYSTYILFCTFFVLLSIIALNVLIGLTVNDILISIKNADLRKLAMRLKYVLQLEDTWNSTKYYVPFGSKNVKPKLAKEITTNSLENV